MTLFWVPAVANGAVFSAPPCAVITYLEGHTAVQPVTRHQRSVTCTVDLQRTMTATAVYIRLTTLTMTNCNGDCQVCSVQYRVQQLRTVQCTHTHMNRANSSLDWVLSHWAHFTVLRFIFLVALCYRADHYIFALWFLSFFFLFFFPRLISATADWMSAILPHMVWP